MRVTDSDVQSAPVVADVSGRLRAAAVAARADSLHGLGQAFDDIAAALDVIPADAARRIATTLL